MGRLTRGDEHKVGLEELYMRLHTTGRGLTSAEASHRLQLYGLNTIESKEGTPLALRFLRHLFNFFAILLWIGSALAFVAESISPGEGNIYISVALAGVVLINATFTFIQEYQSEKIIESFKRMMPSRIEALRDGARVEITASDVAPGDVIYLSEGAKVPADGRLIEENALKVDNSSLTGESEPQLRKLICTHERILESRNMVFSGTLVQSGDGMALVYGTGMDTQLGMIAGLTKKTETAESPLRIELNRFIRIISTIAIVLGVSFFVIGYLSGNRLMASLVFAIGIIVANVPEGLLPTVTLCLSMAARKMARRMALIKRLESVETLGSTTVICTDKTGTITENRISLRTLYINMQEHSVFEKGVEEISGMAEFCAISALCNNARYAPDGALHGDPTEAALMSFAARHSDLRATLDANRRVRESPFDSAKKRMITMNERDGALTSYLKGAPEVVVAACDKILMDGGSAQFTDELKSRVLAYYTRLASRGQRVLALALGGRYEAREEGFTFIALAGMIDPPRREIPGAIAKCRLAGIKVIMVTGDYSVTAEAVARIAGIIGPGGAIVMTGDELDACDEVALRDFLRKDDLIFARTTPMQKLRIVQTLQAMGEVVTVTGDGVNDAPALKHADMGVAMGLSGTEVAKEAADMVLMDDNFATIVNAVEEGRTVFGNIKQFITYILTSNVPEMLPFIAFVLLGVPLPLTVVLILSIDLGTDLLPALGLGVESPEHDVMKYPPRPRTESLLTKAMLLRSYGVMGIIEAAAGFYCYFTVLYDGGWVWGQSLAMNDPLYLRAVTAFFVSIVICQIANVMVCRTRSESVFSKGLLSNRLVLAGIATEIALVWMIVSNPYAQRVFGTVHLSADELLMSWPFAILMVAVEEARKMLLRRRRSLATGGLSW